MLKGKELGKAISIAIERKIARQSIASIAEVARDFKVKPPSVHGWMKTGAISKDKLEKLWGYFSDVAGPEHWGLANWPDGELSAKDGQSSGLVPPLSPEEAQAIRNLRRLPKRKRQSVIEYLQEQSEIERNQGRKLRLITLDGHLLEQADLFS